MPIPNYGLLKGRPIDKRLGFGSNPHYQVHVIDETIDYRIAVNVKSKLSPSELLFLVDEDFDHPITQDLADAPLGFTSLTSEPGGKALDYIRGNLFDRTAMVPLPHNVPGPDNDLNEKLGYYINRAINDGSALLYAFGDRWGPETMERDKYFGFLPGNGIHDIHMNQGNVGRFVDDDGVWQDGGLLIHFEEQQQWVGIFLAFQSQAWHTDDLTGHRVETEPEQRKEGLMRIVAAMVNPLGGDVGAEAVTLVNTSPEPIDLAGWAIADKNKKIQVLTGPVVNGGEAVRIVLDGSGAQLSNKGGIISLLDSDGLKIDGVAYTRTQAKDQGWTVVF